MKFPVHLAIAFLSLTCLGSGCRMFHHQQVASKGRSPLKPAQPSPDSVTLDIVWARYPASEPVLDDHAWREIDETQIDPAVRRALVENGLRAGIIAGTLPPKLEQLMRSGPQPSAHSVIGDEKPELTPLADLATEPVVHGRTKRIRRKQPTEIQASEVYASIPLLVCGGKELSGRTYEQAQAIYSIRVDPQPDRSTLLELTPELQYGAARPRYSGEDGLIRQVLRKDREVFDRLRISVKLAPGEMLVLTSLPDAGSRLGHYFHTVNSTDGPQQKLILLRLAEIPPSDTFASIAEP